MSQNTRPRKPRANSSSSTGKPAKLRKAEDAILVGLTGGIGSGQSTVAAMMEKLGAKIINADKVAKKIIEHDHEVRSDIKSAFGRSVVTRRGGINRKVLANIAFNDAKKTAALNKIVHPRMVSNVIDEIEKSRESRRFPVIALDAALIFEIQLEQMFDQIVVVSSQKNLRLSRVSERDGMAEADILARMARQIPLQEKVKWADHVIHNNGNLEQLEKKVKKVYDLLLSSKRIIAKKHPQTRRPKRAKTNS